MTLEQLHRKMAALGLVHGTSGNASIRVRGEVDWITIKPSGYRCDDIEGVDIVYVPYGPENGRHTLPEGLTPSTDLPIHKAIYDQREDINCVIHTHSPFATAFSCYEFKLVPYVTGTAELFSMGVPCIIMGKGDVIPEPIVKHNSACLVHRHGVFVWGKTPLEALNLAENLEWAARLVLLMQHNVEPMELVDIADCRHWYKTNYGQK